MRLVRGIFSYFYESIPRFLFFDDDTLLAEFGLILVVNISV